MSVTSLKDSPSCWIMCENKRKRRSVMKLTAKLHLMDVWSVRGGCYSLCNMLMWKLTTHYGTKRYFHLNWVISVIQLSVKYANDRQPPKSWLRQLQLLTPDCQLPKFKYNWDHYAYFLRSHILSDCLNFELMHDMLKFLSLRGVNGCSDERLFGKHFYWGKLSSGKRSKTFVVELY